MKLRFFKYLLLSLLLAPTFCFGFSFTFTVTPTTETCSGNGTITINTTDADPNGAIVYLIYKLPDTSSPFAVISDTFLDGLSAGDYRIIAKETIGAISTTQQVDVTIESTVVPLMYAVQSLNQGCNILINVTSGIAVSYEIFSGPKQFPLQTSNSFQDLPLGVYKVRAFDNCGVGVVQTFTVNLNASAITIDKPKVSNSTPPSCDFITVNNTIEADEESFIGYPLKVKYTIFPPNGSTNIIVSNDLNSGDLYEQEVIGIIPFFPNKKYSYQIELTDICGTVYKKKFNVDFELTLDYKELKSDCNQYFSIIPENFIPPYTLNFTNSPANFDPIKFNPNYPGNFTTNAIFGSKDNPVPFGNYDVTITDACNRTAALSFLFKDIPPKPNAVATNNGCLINTGKIVIKLLPNYEIATAIITKAPSTFKFPLPYDVSSKISTSGILTINPVPLGDYEFLLTDTCNNIIKSVTVSIPVFENKELEVEIREGCELNTGSVKIESTNNNKLKSVVITAAPAEFSNNLPYDVSNYIATNGIFYLDNLPQGQYIFETIDECNFSNIAPIDIQGYQIYEQTLFIKKNCGSFDIPLFMKTNGIEEEQFWLQKLLVDGNWGHPETGVVYIEGAKYNNSNSYPLKNLTTNFNLSFNGTFRVVRTFLSFNDGLNQKNGSVTSENKTCFEVLASDLKFNEALELTDANKIPCTANGKLDVILKAKGPMPLKYSIIAKDGVPFLIDNGDSNIFSNLSPAIYTFQIQDNCGGIKIKFFNVSALVSLVVNYTGCDILQCTNSITGNETVNLSTQNKNILGNQSEEEYTLHYFESLSNAQSGLNPIQDIKNYNPSSNPQTIYTRLFFNQLPNCYEINFFNIIIGQTPQFNFKPTILSCSENAVVLNASINNLPSTTYLWSKGETTPACTISETGITNVSVLAKNSYGNCNTIELSCTNTTNVTVNIPDIPEIEKIETEDWTENENSIRVITTKNSAFEYSIDNVTFQDSNLFTNLKTGVYTVYVRNKEGCETISQEIWLLNYPKFFTPNNDGYNDTWLIKNSEFEPHFKVYIYDRLGKLITSFNSNSTGWDGSYNGEKIKSSDYWFVVYRQDGKIFKGHFSLVR